jgi:L-alanine-DL-glutamate epimerase-like enolase superfamily enzyme
MLIRLSARAESWPLRQPFRISRGVKTAADVVVVEAREGRNVGYGESVPYARYGETVDAVLAQIAAVAERCPTRAALQSLLPAGAARNAIDCALWDLEAKRTGRSVAALAGLPAPQRMVTAVTISLDTLALMAAAAAAHASSPLLKVKVDAVAPLAAIQAVRASALHARLIVDPNESWLVDQLSTLLPELADLGVALLEQPVPAGEDGALEGLTPPVPICADEAAHVAADLERVTARYQAVNIKLDKTGGLTEALHMRRRALDMGLTLMVGCMVSTSLSIAPALLLAHGADFVDLDGPWWLMRDREHGVHFSDGSIHPPTSGWGAP